MTLKSLPYFTLLIALLNQNILFSQNEIVPTNNAKESLQIAQSLIKRQEYLKAEKQLLHTIKLKKKFAIAYRLLGTVYLETEQYNAAVSAYEKSFDLDEHLSRAAFFECGDAYLRLSKADLANFYYAKYEKAAEEQYANKKKERVLEAMYDTLLERRIENCDYILMMDTSNIYGYPKNLGKTVNSPQAEYMPAVITYGQKLVFTRSTRFENENIYYSENKDSSWSKVKILGNFLSTPLNEGMAKFSTNGKYLYFAGCQRPDSYGDCDLYKAKVNDKNQIDDIVHLSDQINSSYWDSQPSISCNGETMVFSSNRKGGFGGADLYISHLTPSGEWGTPLNLGPDINTSGDEQGPFITNDGKTLYFSSDGHLGQGLEDIYITRFLDNEWTPAENLGYPINSPCRELGFHITEDNQKAFFASSRPGGMGGLDLYEVPLSPAYRPSVTITLQGNVFDEETEFPVAAEITVLGKNGNKWKTHSDKQGWFFLCVPEGKAYSFIALAEGYKERIVSSYFDKKLGIQTIDIALEPIKSSSQMTPEAKPPTEERRIQFFFEVDSYALKEKVINDLKELSEYLKQDTSWEVEIVGYADTSGDSNYNRILSEKRALSIANFLKDEGILTTNIVKSEGKGVDAKAHSAAAGRRVDVVLRR